MREDPVVSPSRRSTILELFLFKTVFPFCNHSNIRESDVFNDCEKKNGSPFTTISSDKRTTFSFSVWLYKIPKIGLSSYSITIGEYDLIKKRFFELRLLLSVETSM